MAGSVCAKCKAEAKHQHAFAHLTPEQEAYGRKMRRVFAELESQFEDERRACFAALARGEKPQPGQAKLDRLHGIPLPVTSIEPEPDQLAVLMQSTEQMTILRKEIVVQIRSLRKKVAARG